MLNLRNITQQRTTKKREFKRPLVLPPRANKMATDQDWTAVWPGPRTFHPASVPLPLRQGYNEQGPTPAKYANTELMKIPNFLHLTPPAIRRQCEALKKFCTQWPKGLETDEKCEKYFPLKVIHTDYCQAIPTIRNNEARRVTVTLPLSKLKFDNHSRDKFLRLVGERYNESDDTLTLIADRCPLRKQNYDYAMYLLTACYHESFVVENWESLKSEEDMEVYLYERNQSKISVENILNWKKEALEEKQGENKERKTASKGFIESVERLINEGENEYNLNRYKEEVLKLLEITPKNPNENQTN